MGFCGAWLLVRKRGLAPQSRPEFFDIPLDKHKQHDKRKDVGYIYPCPSGETKSPAGVGLAAEVVPAPAVAGGAEQQIYERAERQDVVADQKILQVEDGAAGTEQAGNPKAG